MSGNNGPNYTGLDDADFARVIVCSAYGRGTVIRVWRQFVLEDLKRLHGHFGPGVRVTVLADVASDENGWAFTTPKRSVRKCT